MKSVKKVLSGSAVGAIFASVAGVLTGCGSPDSSIGSTEEAYTLGSWSALQATLASPAFTTGNSPNLPICRAPWDGGWQPGKYWAGQCLFEFGNHGYAAGPNVPGRNANTPKFETLFNTGRESWVEITQCVQWSQNGCLKWAPTGSFPQNAIDGGPSGNSSGNQPLPVCKVFQFSAYQAGKYWANGCNIEYNGSGYHVGTDHDIWIAVRN